VLFIAIFGALSLPVVAVLRLRRWTDQRARHAGGGGTVAVVPVSGRGKTAMKATFCIGRRRSEGSTHNGLRWSGIYRTATREPRAAWPAQPQRRRRRSRRLIETAALDASDPVSALL